ncbi:MAG: methylmalonyl-CoA mutase small subunit [Dactylosporangium sp.]|nr:methylmalonyl-CoA mutase subunit beta [Dactylosporangium sp.]NNJ60495.1 methylmalonyl-CoA mutase small subunit [Dactylosporangium sp.]
MNSRLGELPLAAAFPPADSDQWRRLALGALRKSGKAGDDTLPEAVDELLAKVTYDGITIAALHSGSTERPPIGVPGAPPFVRGRQAAGAVATGWDVRQRHAHPDAGVARAEILADLEHGVTSLWLVLGQAGLAPAELPAVLDGVHLDLAGVVLDAGAQTAEAAEIFLNVADDGHAPTAKVNGNLGADPIGLHATAGTPIDLPVLTTLAARIRGSFPNLRTGMVDATPYHDAGGSDAQELGCSIATGVAYLRALTAAGLTAADAFAQLEFRYAATVDQFLTVAKLRAARRLWARVAEVAGAPQIGAQRQHAVTSSAMMTARDPWVNMLRTTVACFAAGIGGADAVTVEPFDACLGLPDAFSRRIARNTQALLLEESNLAKVIDPAGGSWYVEHLTDELARTAWDWFTEIERAGGIVAALDTGLVTARIDATWATRSKRVAKRSHPITGVSEFPNLDEQLPVRAPAPVAAGGGVLPRRRYAQVFETLRDRADAHPGSRPTVFLATIGSVAAHTARASFAANLFAAGGIATVSGGPGTDVAEIARRFADSGLPVACLCSTDKLYAEHAEDVAAALVAAGAKKVWLAGAPKRYAGVDAYLHLGCDTVAVLETTLADLDVKAAS